MSGLGIPEIMMNIMSCHGLSISTIRIVIIVCCSVVVPYYFSKGFLIVEKVEGKFENIPEQVLKQTNAFPLQA